jgi:hypothetical protein
MYGLDRLNLVMLVTAIVEPLGCLVEIPHAPLLLEQGLHPPLLVLPFMHDPKPLEPLREA